MKYYKLFVIILIGIAFVGCKTRPHNKEFAINYVYKKQYNTKNPLYNQHNMLKGGCVRTPKDAFDIARIILYQVYGEEKINNEMPLNISLYKGIWIVDGSLPDSYEKDGVSYLTLGGVAHIEIRAYDAKVLNVLHGK